jgi:hypothetical protein
MTFDKLLDAAKPYKLGSMKVPTSTGRKIFKDGDVIGVINEKADYEAKNPTHRIVGIYGNGAVIHYLTVQNLTSGININIRP